MHQLSCYAVPVQQLFQIDCKCLHQQWNFGVDVCVMNTISHTKHMTKLHDRMIKAQHMASCDLAPFPFHIGDPEPQST